MPRKANPASLPTLERTARATMPLSLSAMERTASQLQPEKIARAVSRPWQENPAALQDPAALQNPPWQGDPAALQMKRNPLSWRGDLNKVSNILIK